jgi:hypothetical protein
LPAGAPPTERFWSDRAITDETPVVCERFRLIARFS